MSETYFVLAEFRACAVRDASCVVNPVWIKDEGRILQRRYIPSEIATFGTQLRDEGVG